MVEPQTVGEGSAKDFGGEVAALGSTERTLGDDPRVGNGEDRGLDVFATRLAAEGEVAALGCGQVEHRTSIGEERAKVLIKYRE
jgi:hypothetical protein